MRRTAARLTSRSPGRRLTAAVLVVLVVAAAGLGAVRAWPGLPRWVAIAAPAVAAVLVGLGPLWQGWRERSAARAGTIRRGLRGTRGTDGSRLPTVAEAGLTDVLRVHRAVVEVPYLARAAKEREVGEHLSAGRPVLLVGSSMVGKTRLAAEVAKRLYADRPILVPDTPAALAELDGADVFPQGHVIWLDDLERFLVGGELTAGLLQRLAGTSHVIGTLRAKEWDRLQPTDQLRPPQWDVLTCFELVTLDRDRDRPAEDDLERAIPDPAVREQVRQVGIGEYVGAAEHIRRHLELGAQVNPLGYALVLAAADWWLAGIARPVPAELLPRLAAARLPDRHRDKLDDPDRYAAALGWATREINPTVSLLEPRDAGYTVYDYALDHLTTQGHTIPDATWELAIAAADNDELYEISYQAWNRGHSDIAERAGRPAAEAGHTDAMVALGVLLTEQGAAAKADMWYRKAAEAGNPSAMFNLGLLQAKRGERAAAETWYRRAAEADYGNAMLNLGVLLERRGEHAEAEMWFRKAVEADQVGATNALGVLLSRRGEQAEAETWLRKASEAGDTHAMLNLGVLLDERGDRAEAETWNRKAAEAGDTRAMNNLGLMLEERGERAEAETWYRKAAETGHIYATYNLGVLLEKRGDRAEAETWYREAAEAGHTDAMTNLENLLRQRGARVDAETWFRSAAEAAEESPQ